MARKRLEGTVAQNVLKYGTGGLNIDGCRIGSEQRFNPPTHKSATPAMGSFANCVGQGSFVQGRWAANVLFDELGAAELDMQEDGASRFFYVAKASTKEKSVGLTDVHFSRERKPMFTSSGGMHGASLERVIHNKDTGSAIPRLNYHPTVKPITLMRYLCRLVTPPNGVVLDPFMGSGTTGCAAVLEGFRFVGIERDEEYARIAKARIAHWQKTMETHGSEGYPNRAA
jgi:site-specific DNA-methyltransferase (adenine-specific)